MASGKWFTRLSIKKFHSHEKEIRFINSILPITKTVLETGQFDPHLMKNPALANECIRHWGYQKGLNYGYENTKAMILDRDDYTCQHCKNRRKDSKLEVHHIIYRCNGGSDEADNLITLCSSCHKDLHSGMFTLKLTGKKKGQLKHATQMNSIRCHLLKTYPRAIETFGYVTKANRQALGIDKSHHMDAAVIATGGDPVNMVIDTIYIKRDVPKGDYQKTKGIRSEQSIRYYILEKNISSKAV